MNAGSRPRQESVRRATVQVAAVVVAATLSAASPAASAAAPLSLTASPGEIRSGSTTAITGTLQSPAGAPVGAVTVELQADPYPYRGFFDAAHTTTAADGSFAFAGLAPDRNTRYRVRWAGGDSLPVRVYVDAPATLRSFDRGPGRTMLTMLAYHSGYFRWINVPTYWYVAPLGSRVFHLAAVTRTRELRPGITYAAATIDPPARRFAFRVCFNGVGEAGAGPPAAHPPCPRGDFTLRR